MSSEANEKGLEQLLKANVALQNYFDKALDALSTVAAYLVNPCVGTELQVRLAWCLMGIERSKYEPVMTRDRRNKSWN